MFLLCLSRYQINSKIKRGICKYVEKILNKNVNVKIENERLASQGCKDNYKKLLFKCTPTAKREQGFLL